MTPEKTPAKILFGEISNLEVAVQMAESDRGASDILSALLGEGIQGMMAIRLLYDADIRGALISYAFHDSGGILAQLKGRLISDPAALRAAAKEFGYGR